MRSSGAGDYAEALAEVDRLAELLEDLLELARVEAGTAAPEPIPPAALAARLGTWREVHAARGLTLVVDVARAGADAPPLPGPAARIADIALDNSAKFVPSGGTVTVSLDAAGALRIADDGPGLAPEQLAAAPGRFCARRTTGTSPAAAWAWPSPPSWPAPAAAS